jgi:hypothetical protein
MGPLRSSPQVRGGDLYTTECVMASPQPATAAATQLSIDTNIAEATTVSFDHGNGGITPSVVRVPIIGALPLPTAAVRITRRIA